MSALFCVVLLDGDQSASSSVGSSLLANILPDLTHLQCLKKVRVVKKQQKETGVLIESAAPSLGTPSKGTLQTVQGPQGVALQKGSIYFAFRVQALLVAECEMFEMTMILVIS